MTHARVMAGLLTLLATLLVACGGLDADDVRRQVLEATGSETYVARDGGDLVLWFREPVKDARVYASTDGDASPAPTGEPTARLEEGTRLRLPGLAQSGRVYLTVELPGREPFVTAERVLPLEGAQNFRDLGGYESADGRRVRWGQVYRSDALAELTPGDLAVLEGIGLRLVCDFRSDEEVADEPSRIPAGASIVREPITDEQVQPSLLRERITEGDVEGLDAAWMQSVYTGMLDDHAPRFGAALRRLADAANRPAVVHCTAGKDRTGLLSALLLRALGVPEAQVVGDYLLTETYTWRRIRKISLALLLRGVEPVTLRPLIGTDPKVIEAALAHLRDRHGGVEDYLTGPAGLEPLELGALRSALLR